MNLAEALRGLFELALIGNFGEAADVGLCALLHLEVVAAGLGPHEVFQRRRDIVLLHNSLQFGHQRAV